MEEGALACLARASKSGLTSEIFRIARRSLASASPVKEGVVSSG